MKQLYLDIIHYLNYNIVGEDETEDDVLFGLHKNLFIGQLASPDLIPTFPCILVDIPYSYYKDVSAKIQHGYALVKIIVCFKTEDLTGALVTDAFDLKDHIYTKIQGIRREPPKVAPVTPGYSPFTRGGERTETKYEGLYVFEMDFYTTLLDTGVYARRNFVNAKTYNVAPYTLPSGHTSREIEVDVTKHP